MRLTTPPIKFIINNLSQMEMQPHPTFGNGKICYLEIPSRNIKESSSFYHAVFGWKIRTRGDGSVAFDDSVNEVSGTWKTDRKPVTEKASCCTSWWMILKQAYN